MRVRMAIARCCCAQIAVPVYRYAHTSFWMTSSSDGFIPPGAGVGTAHYTGASSNTFTGEAIYNDSLLFFGDFAGFHALPGRTIHSAHIEFDFCHWQMARWATGIAWWRSRLVGRRADDVGWIPPASTLDAESRPRTAAFVDWNHHASEPEVLYNHLSPNIAPIVQEIIDHADWTPERGIGFFHVDHGSDTRTASGVYVNRLYTGWSYTPGPQGMRLFIEAS